MGFFKKLEKKVKKFGKKAEKVGKKALKAPERVFKDAQRIGSDATDFVEGIGQGVRDYMNPEIPTPPPEATLTTGLGERTSMLDRFGRRKTKKVDSAVRQPLGGNS